MKIAGLQKTSLIDYPEKISTVVFTYGCNLRCPYCHNSGLVKNNNKNIDFISLDLLFEFLRRRKKLIDGVCITGGEPTLQTGLEPFIRKIKKNRDSK